MKLYDLTKIYPIFDRFASAQYSNFVVALEIAKLKKTIQEKIEFYNEQEMKLAKTYGAKDKDGNLIVKNGSQIRFESVEDARKFNELALKLRTTDINFGKPIKIDLHKDIIAKDFSLTPNDILAVEELIEINCNDECEVVK